MSFQVITGDALTNLRGMADESVDCCVTSPPYWGLRDYGHAGQMGLEPTPGEYVAAMVALLLRASSRPWDGPGRASAGLPGSKPGVDSPAGAHPLRADDASEPSPCPSTEGRGDLALRRMPRALFEYQP